jgi:hypothetical protein
MSAPDEPSRKVIYGAAFQVVRITKSQTGQMSVGLRIRAAGDEFTFGVQPDTARQLAGSLLNAADLADPSS